MNRFFFNILLALAWMLLTGESSASSFISGMVVGYLILWMSRPAFGRDTYLSKIPQVTGFVLYFLKELILANLRSPTIFSRRKTTWSRASWRCRSMSKPTWKSRFSPTSSP